ncbi:OmpH family outer membrane protein [Thiohalocapsa marina]|uniref:OmpH family outer membrane protein n=1 Tax=Thiohalocapsa marina TaxID=424902 RepID=A0A5M8FQK6_9GAMM|nr:OmpH family outer membrane protein [Thiohalocapsa marina]KAA6184805.1 OmpH family outer membrane protein [Thiohalocapsa marina]
MPSPIAITRRPRVRALLAAALLLLPVAGIQASEFRIAVIDPNRIVEESPQYEEARAMLSNEVMEREAELLEQQEDLDRLNEQLERDGALMSEDELKRLQSDIRARKRRLRYAQAELQEDFALRQTELRTKLVKQVEEVVRQVAKEQEIDLILSEGLVYFSQRVDISGDVVERLKQEFEAR